MQKLTITITELVEIRDTALFHQQTAAEFKLRLERLLGTIQTAQEEALPLWELARASP
jgi:hypothetical protein